VRRTTLCSSNPTRLALFSPPTTVQAPLVAATGHCSPSISRRALLDHPFEALEIVFQHPLKLPPEERPRVVAFTRACVRQIVTED
jgi:hypothetical protein